jgi:hypothetical protein
MPPWYDTVRCLECSLEGLKLGRALHAGLPWHACHPMRVASHQILFSTASQRIIHLVYLNQDQETQLQHEGQCERHGQRWEEGLPRYENAL